MNNAAHVEHDPEAIDSILIDKETVRSVIEAQSNEIKRLRNSLRLEYRLRDEGVNFLPEFRNAIKVLRLFHCHMVYTGSLTELQLCEEVARYSRIDLISNISGLRFVNNLPITEDVRKGIQDTIGQI